MKDYLKKYKKQICLTAAVCLLGTAAFCGFHIYHHYAQVEEQTEAFEQIAEVVEEAPESEPASGDTPVSEGEDVLAKYRELYLHFDTLTEQAEYEIVAVFKTVAYSAEGYRYYDFVNAETEEAFAEYVAKCKELALYDTGVSAEYGDKLITLSTCEYSAQNGRLVVVAKKVV